MYRVFLKGFIVCISFMMVISICLLPINATSNSDFKSNEEVVEARFSNITMFRNSFEISSVGKANITSFVSSNNTDEVRIYCYLQQYDNGVWKDIKAWSNTTKGTEGYLTGSWYVARGYTYRLISYTYLYKNNSNIESANYTSKSIYY